MYKRCAKRTLLCLACITALMALLSACRDPIPTLSPLGPEAVILAFGDSLTYGTGTGNDNSYPAVLERLSRRRVINGGVPGEVAETGLSRLPLVLDRHQPDLLILCHGGNDLLRRNGQEQIYASLNAMVTLAQSRGVDVVLIGVPQPKLLFLRPAEIYDQLAEKLQLVYLRDELPRLESDPAMKSDPIHLNREGYRRLAESIHQRLVASGALPAE